MEEDDLRNEQQPNTVQHNSLAYLGPNPIDAMAVTMYGRSFENSMTAMTHEYQRQPLNQHHHTYDHTHTIQEPTMSPYHMDPGDIPQGIQPIFSQYNDNERGHQYSLPEDRGTFPTYPPCPIQPRLQQPPLYAPVHAPVQPFQTRHIPMLPPSYHMYTGPQHQPASHHTIGPLEASPNLFAAPVSLQPAYDPILVSSSENIGEAYQTSQNRPQPGHLDFHPQPKQSRAATLISPPPPLNHHYAGGDPQLQQQNELDTRMEQFKHLLGSVNNAIRIGSLQEASTELLQASNWLISNIVLLGFHHDNPIEYDRRLMLWRDFNHCWEALAQGQKNIMLREHETGQHDGNALSADAIRKMVSELVALCDQIQKHGLVDFEMGVWEDQIVDAFMVCLDLMQEL